MKLIFLAITALLFLNIGLYSQSLSWSMIILGNVLFTAIVSLRLYVSYQETSKFSFSLQYPTKVQIEQRMNFRMYEILRIFLFVAFISYVTAVLMLI